MGYPSDVNGDQWKEIESFFEPEHIGRPRKYPAREIYNAIRYVERSGCQWRMLPKDFPPWEAVYMTFWRWRNAGVWEEINHHLRRKIRVKAGRNPDPSVAIVDSQSVKTTQKGGSAVMTAASRSRAENATSQRTRKGTS
jgi:transposase